MNDSHFVLRDRCTACHSCDVKAMYSCGFLDPPIRDYLERFYVAAGHIELKYLDGATYSLVECQTCGLIFQREIPSDLLMLKLYEEWIDPRRSLDKSLRRRDLRALSTQTSEILMILAYLDRPPNSLTFLDFGMGWGEWCLMAKAFGIEVYGIELSEARIDYARALGLKVLTWDELPDHQFDFINADQVFEHIPCPLETLRHLVGSLVPGGLLKISVPDGRDIKRRLRIGDWGAPKGSRNSLNAVSPLEHINCFTHDAVVKMSSMAGLEEVKIPAFIQLAYTADWRRPHETVKRLIYRNILSRGTYLFFRHREGQ